VSLRAEAIRTRLRGIREVLGVLGTTPRVVGLVWGAHPRIAAAVLGLNVAQGLNPLANAWLNKLVLDAVVVAVTQPVGAGGAGDAARAVGVLLIIRAAYQVLNAAAGAPARYCWQQLSDHTTRRLERLILTKAIGLKGIAFFESPRFFDLLQRVQNQAMNRPINIISNLTGITRGLLEIVTMAGAFFIFSPWLTLLILVATLPHVVSQFRNRRETFEIHSWAHPEVRTMHYMTALVTHKVDAKEVRLFGLGDFLLRRYLDAFASFHRRLFAARLRHLYATLGMSALSAGAHALGFAAVIVAAAQGRITIGDLLLYTTALARIHDGMTALVRLSAHLYESHLYVGTLFDYLAVQESLPTVAAGAARRLDDPLKQGVELRNVAFAYPNKEAPVLEDVSFSIAPGQVVALVGQNGAGKSTLVKLLTRLYDPTGGQILVDGIDLREYDLDDWRRRIAVVFQRFNEYAMTARENVGVGWLPLMDDLPAIQTAAGRAGADSLIEGLPDGYDTMLGRRFNIIGSAGVDLSGGQWQRVALARAFLRTIDPAGAQLLILDEPTSALDARAEHELYARFKELTEGRATLLISHRFSTVRMADHIVVLDGGRIVEQGSHAQLMAAGGTYARLYAMQADRYADDVEAGASVAAGAAS
jgi:ATP-binding cassette subfamily B protein